MPVATASSKLLEPILQLARHYPATSLPSDTEKGHAEQLASQKPASLQQQLLDDAGLTQKDFTRPDTRFPAHRFTRVLSRLAKASNNPHISLRLAEATQPRMLGSTGFLISTSDTLGQALHILEEYLGILFESAHLRLEFSAEYDAGIESVRLLLALDEPQQNVTEFFLACLLNWPRWLTGQQIPIQCVELTHPEAEDPARYRQLFAAEVTFNKRENAVVFPAHYLTLPCTDANPELHQLHRAFADALLGKSQSRTALAAQVRHLIREQVLTQGETIRREEVARELGLSLRTLQRKLGELGTNFQTLYDETRKALCLEFIHQGDLSFGEIAFQLGFSNQSAFQKAFKRWTGIPPSQYRQNLKLSPKGSGVERKIQKPEMTEDRAGLRPNTSIEPDNHRDIRDKNPDQWLEQKLQRLNPFGLKVLQQSAVVGASFGLKFLSRLTQEPEARLMIHLWPAQEEQLIEPEESTQGQPGFNFTAPWIHKALFNQLTRREQLQIHYRASLLLWQTLPTPPNTAALDELLSHLNSLTELPVNGFNPKNQPGMLQVISLNQTAAIQALSDGQIHKASNLVDQAKRWIKQWIKHRTKQNSADTDSVEIPDNSAFEGTLYQQAKLELSLGDAETALSTLDQCGIDRSKQPILRLKAKILINLNQPADALKVLLSHLTPAIPHDKKEQLVFLLNALEEIQQLRRPYASPPSTMKKPAKGGAKDILDQLLLLETASDLARRESQPLLTACLISRMTQLCLRLNQEKTDETDSFSQPLISLLTRYALVGYAWVASWFLGDYLLCDALLQQGLTYPIHSPTLHQKDLIGSAQQSSELPGDIRPLTELWQIGQVQHWLEPLHQVQSRLRRLGERVRRKSDSFIYHEQNVLWYQLASLNGEYSLNRLKVRCQQEQKIRSKQTLTPSLAQHHDTELVDSGVLLADLLQGKTPIPQQPAYLRPLQAANQIRAALILNRQTIWPALFNWQSQLENDLPGHFIITETLFSIGMMRLILSQQENQVSQRRLRIIDQTESRFELWSRQIPENFAGQYHLLLAEKNRLIRAPDTRQESCSDHFEKAISLFEQQGFHAHQALCFERYGNYLQSKSQNRVAKLCFQQARKLYQSWGATLKVSQLESLLSDKA